MQRPMNLNLWISLYIKITRTDNNNKVIADNQSDNSNASQKTQPQQSDTNNSNQNSKDNPNDMRNNPR